MGELANLATLIKQHNVITNQIAHLIGRPAGMGHIGEYIAAQIFGITLAASAVNKSSDGYFNRGALAGKSVNIKWYGKWEGLLDITPILPPDYYLVMTGAKAAATSSRGGTRPWGIEFVFLFEAVSLNTQLSERKVKIGVATSVIRQLWQEAEIYPIQRNQMLILSEEQKQFLALFRQVGVPHD